MIYKVKTGDTLGKIASEQLGDYAKWHDIAIFNDLSNPHLIYEGQELELCDKKLITNTMVPHVLNSSSGTSQPMLEAVDIEETKNHVYAITPTDTILVGRKFRKGIYRLGQQNISSDTSIYRKELDTLGYKKTISLKLVEAIANNEGLFDAINTWDNSFLSFGIYQWTLGVENSAGELPALLKIVKETFPQEYEHYWGQFGLDISADTKTTTGFLKLKNRILDTAEEKEQLRAPIWALRFARAGADIRIQIAQLMHATRRLNRFYNAPIVELDNTPLSSLISSEYGVALLLDHHVNRPGHVIKVVIKACKALGKEASDLANGSTQDEEAILQEYLKIRDSYGATPMTDARKRADQVYQLVEKGILSQEKDSFDKETFIL